MKERRQYPRIIQPLDGTYRGHSGASPCRISDISWGGCYLQTMTSPGVSERTIVTVVMPVNGRSVEIPATVRYVEPAMGFSVMFDNLSPDQVDALTDVLGEPPPVVLEENLQKVHRR